jgi:hypothetical protein
MLPSLRRGAATQPMLRLANALALQRSQVERARIGVPGGGGAPRTVEPNVPCSSMTVEVEVDALSGVIRQSWHVSELVARASTATRLAGVVVGLAAIGLTLWQ